ncbi:MAG: adenosylcobinamide kinase, partial [Lachnospira sp.]|nr:adenosylcobinamide kinase [Lachnospira sp.]
CSNIIIVTNDIFSDGCIYYESTREYIRQLAYINRQLAQDADIVEEVVYSVPVRLKTIYESI